MSLPTILPPVAPEPPMPEVLVEPDGSAVYATWGNRQTWRLSSEGELTEQYRQAPELPEQLLDLDDVVARIASVKLSKAARVALAERFGVSPEDLVTR